jgi:hypothetical protein
MNELERAARAIDAYAGEAVNVEPAVGSVAVPLRLIVQLHRALSHQPSVISGVVA